MATTQKCALSVSLILCALWALTATVSATPYVSPKGYQLNVPDGWTVAPGYQAADLALLAPPVYGLTSNFNVTTSPGPPATAEQIRGQFDNIRSQFNAMYAKFQTDSHILSQVQRTVDGSPALDTTLDYNQPITGSSPVVLRMRQVIVFRPGTIFTLTCTMSEAEHSSYDPVFDNIIKSMHWMDGAGQSVPPAATASPAAVFHSTKGYELTPPTGWDTASSQLSGLDLALAKFVQSGPVPSLRITVKPNAEGITLDDFQKAVNITFARDFPHYSIVWQGYFMLDGVRALATKSTDINNNGEPILTRQVEINRLGMRYSITFSSPNSNHADYDAVFEAMIKSFHWTH